MVQLAIAGLFKKMGSHLNWLHKIGRGDGTVNVFFGFFLIINYCLGTGFLGIPYAFFYGGYIAAIPTLLFITFLAWINANYILEIMARAQVSQLVNEHYPFVSPHTSYIILMGHLLPHLKGLGTGPWCLF